MKTAMPNAAIRWLYAACQISLLLLCVSCSSENLLCSQQVEFPVKLGMDRKSVEAAVGQLKPFANQSDVLWIERYGVMFYVTENDIVHTIRVNREYAELDIESSLYRISKHDTLDSLTKKLGKPFKTDRTGYFEGYFFRKDGIDYDVVFAIQRLERKIIIPAGEIVSFGVRKGL
jgi:hypothetical protein